MERLYLTRRNLQTLINKLDRNKVYGGSSECTLIKQDTTHSVYPCSSITMVTAVEDEDYYTDRSAGKVMAEDEPKRRQ